MTTAEFINLFSGEIPKWVRDMEDSSRQWVVKGFIDTRRKIYTISTDTKVVSKILELYLFPRLQAFVECNGLQMELAPEQNFYPDLTIRDSSGNLFAIDVKSSYRKRDGVVNGFTLGAFTGYFRNRASTKNCVHPYGDYRAHLVLGVLYSVNSHVDERRVYDYTELNGIPSVLSDFQFFLQEKWRIAADRPGSGNTKNIGSITKIADLVAGRGPFSCHGEAVFDQYWINYLTRDMARAAELQAPYYRNLQEYLELQLPVRRQRN